MKQLWAVALAIGSVSCAQRDEDKLDYQEVEVDTTPDRLDIAIPPSKDLQYAAWSLSENKALSKWTNNRGEAESAGSEYGGKFPDREWTILWRQRPDSEPWIPKAPRD